MLQFPILEGVQGLHVIVSMRIILLCEEISCPAPRAKLIIYLRSVRSELAKASQ